MNNFNMKKLKRFFFITRKKLNLFQIFLGILIRIIGFSYGMANLTRFFWILGRKKLISEKMFTQYFN